MPRAPGTITNMARIILNNMVENCAIFMVADILNFGRLILLRKIATLIVLCLYNQKIQNQVKVCF